MTELLGELQLNKIYNMYCNEGMKLIPDNSIDLVVTSPPYDNIRKYGGEWTLDLNSVGQEISRILKDGGICAMVIQDQTIDGRKSLTTFKTIVNWVESTEMDLWECCLYERSGTPGAWWNKRFRVDHEYIPIFIKGKRPQHFDKTELMIEAIQGGIVKSTGGGRRTDGETNKNTVKEINKLKCRGTIWDYTNDSKSRDKIKNQHPATYPDRLAADIIKAFTLEDMIVLDPFMGSGTTAVMAKSLGRQYIGFDISDEYIEISNIRLREVK